MTAGVEPVRDARVLGRDHDAVAAVAARDGLIAVETAGAADVVERLPPGVPELEAPQQRVGSVELHDQRLARLEVEPTVAVEVVGQPLAGVRAGGECVAQVVANLLDHRLPGRGAPSERGRHGAQQLLAPGERHRRCRAGRIDAFEDHGRRQLLRPVAEVLARQQVAGLRVGTQPRALPALGSLGREHHLEAAVGIRCQAFGRQGAEGFVRRPHGYGLHGDQAGIAQRSVQPIRATAHQRRTQVLRVGAIESPALDVRCAEAQQGKRRVERCQHALDRDRELLGQEQCALGPVDLALLGPAAQDLGTRLLQ
jgi:hypothetical protein